ncbi:Carboxylic ester hydrolase [Sergentomyia squamirostris]
MDKLSVIVIFLSVIHTLSYGAIVRTNNGPVRGEKFSNYYAFLGVQYAESPIEQKRFEPVGIFRETWTEVKKATEFAPYCLQSRNNKVSGEEDCLFLNVYTSQIDVPEEAEKLPVFVHFHGGGFTFGSGTFFTPERMLKLNRMVFVTVNYRLGPLGFLSTEDEVVPGNMGLKDQVVALQWIKENIENFGGNPESVTLSGFSAGGASVHLHYLSPLSRGLFHRGISHSGCALNPWVLTEKSQEKAKKLASLLSCPSTTSVEMIECLKSKPARELVNMVPHFQPWISNPFTPFGVVVEHFGKDSFLPSHPEIIYKDNKVAKLPWIVGFTDAEGIFPAGEFLQDSTSLSELRDRWDELARFVLDFNATVRLENIQDVSDSVLRHYLGKKDLSEKNFDDLVKMMSDRHFGADISRCVRHHSKVAKTYLYFFAFPAKFGVSQITLGMDTKVNGAAHGDDVFILLKNKHDPREEQTTDERAMNHLLTDMYMSFADNSTPRLGDYVFEDVTSRGYLSMLQINSPRDITMKVVSSVGDETFWISLAIDEFSIPGENTNQEDRSYEEL